MSNFVGSKGGAGIAQWIISQMPAHRTYVEAFLGKGVILKTKLPAHRNIGIEANPAVIESYHRAPQFELIQGNALTVLPALKLDSTALVYADPPYLGSVRRDAGRAYYGCELLREDEHERLLSVLTGLQAMVMLSGYWSELYDRTLTQARGWRVKSKWTVNRAGQRVQEFLWLNFGAPVFLHDVRFIGADYTDRQAKKRKVERWRKKFAAMAAGEQCAILEALTAVIDRQPVNLHRHD